MSIPHTLNWIENFLPGKIYASEGAQKVRWILHPVGRIAYLQRKHFSGWGKVSRKKVAVLLDFVQIKGLGSEFKAEKT